MKGFVNVQSLVYSAVLGIVAAAVMTGVGEFTRPYREANAKADRIRNILAALAIEVKPGTASQELLHLYAQNVREDAAGARYVYAPGGSAEVKAVAVPVDGAGLWGPIHGFLAIEADMRTIRGLTFYHQEETPGLGGEIEKEWFLSQFRGKSILGPDGRPRLAIKKKGAATGANEIDGITGATMTCDKLAEILNAAIKKIPEGAR